MKPDLISAYWSFKQNGDYCVYGAWEDKIGKVDFGGEVVGDLEEARTGTYGVETGTVLSKVETGGGGEGEGTGCEGEECGRPRGS